ERTPRLRAPRPPQAPTALRPPARGARCAAFLGRPTRPPPDPERGPARDRRAGPRPRPPHLHRRRQGHRRHRMVGGPRQQRPAAALRPSRPHGQRALRAHRHRLRLVVAPHQAAAL
ncbi:MAG: DNA_ligase_IV_Ku-like, partial [uncultured Nocardioidaceae bacterium]